LHQRPFPLVSFVRISIRKKCSGNVLLFFFYPVFIGVEFPTDTRKPLPCLFFFVKINNFFSKSFFLFLVLVPSNSFVRFVTRGFFFLVVFKRTQNATTLYGFAAIQGQTFPCCSERDMYSINLQKAIHFELFPPDTQESMQLN